MRGCFDTPSIAFLYTICNSSFLPFSENLCKENLPALDKGLLIIFTDKNHRVIRRIISPQNPQSVRERYSRQPADHTSVAGRRYYRSLITFRITAAVDNLKAHCCQSCCGITACSFAAAVNDLTDTVLRLLSLAGGFTALGALLTAARLSLPVPVLRLT